jgi:hypothetical protein
MCECSSRMLLICMHVGSSLYSCCFLIVSHAHALKHASSICTYLRIHGEADVYAHWNNASSMVIVWHFRQAHSAVLNQAA